MQNEVGNDIQDVTGVQIYRGILKSGKVWIYGDLIKNKGKLYIHPQSDSFDVSEGGVGMMFTAHEIIPETLSLCSGKKDAQGNAIYSGHILKNKQGILFLVQYGSFAMYCPVDDAMMENIGFVVTSVNVPGDMPLGPTEQYAMIVGDIFNNPELYQSQEGLV